MAGSDVKDTTQGEHSAYKGLDDSLQHPPLAEKRGRGRPKGSKTKKGLPGTRSSTRRKNDSGPPKVRNFSPLD
jgi:hypothetical protein